jgi:hypothetical protein
VRYKNCIRPPPYVFCGYNCKQDYKDTYGEYKRLIEWNPHPESPEKEWMNIVLCDMMKGFKCYVCGGGILCRKYWIRERIPGDHCGEWDEYYPTCSEICLEEYHTPQDSSLSYVFK